MSAAKTSTGARTLPDGLTRTPPDALAKAESVGGLFSAWRLPSVRGYRNAAELNDKIRQMAEAGICDKDIAEVLGVEKQSVSRRRRRAGIASAISSTQSRADPLHRVRIPDSFEDEVRGYVALRKSDAQIGVKLGTSKRVVRYFRLARGIPSGRDAGNLRYARAVKAENAREADEWPTPRMPDKDPFEGYIFPTDPVAEQADRHGSLPRREYTYSLTGRQM